MALFVGFTFFGPRGGFYAASAVAAFVGQSPISAAVSIYLVAVSTLGLLVLMAYMTETYLVAGPHRRMAWGTSLLAAASFLIGWGLYFAPSISVISGGPAIDPAISYTFTSAGLIVLFGVGGLFMGAALATLELAGVAAPLWVRAANRAAGVSGLLSMAFILLAHWSPNQWLPVPFYVIVLWGFVIGVWLVVSPRTPLSQPVP